MNAHEAFPGTGIRQAFSEPDRPADMRPEDFDYLVGEAMEEAKARERKQQREESEEIMAGMTASEIAAMEAAATLVDEALSQPIPTPTGTEKDRAVFERSIAARRAEKARQQAIAAAAMAKARQLTASIRSMEDALDGLLVSEA